MKKSLLISFLVMAVVTVHSQQDVMFTHYMYNTMSVNPGYAGSRDALSATLLHRTQWATLDGAPETQTFTIHSPVFNEQMGIGLSVINDVIGPSKKTSFYGDFSYRILINDLAHLAFGLKAGVNMYKTSFAGFDIGNVYDESFQEEKATSLKPNFGFGAYYYADRYYVGLSAPKLLENKLTLATAKEVRHYFLIGGMVIDLTDKIKFKPTTFVKVTKAAPVETDLTAAFLYNNIFEMGIKFRTGDAWGFLVGVDITRNLTFGYSFDSSYRVAWDSVEKNIQRSSHELMLRYELRYDDKIRSPRFF